MQGPQAPIEAAGVPLQPEVAGEPVTRGTPDRALPTGIDESPSEPAESSLARSESRLASAVRIAEIGFYEAVEDDRITFLDDRIRTLFGIPPEEGRLPRHRWTERVHPDDLDRVKEASRAMRSGASEWLAIQYRYQHPDRGLLWLDHRSAVLARDASGNVTRVIGVVQDITARKLTEEVLRDLAGRYDALTSTTRDGFWELDGEGRILVVNDEACQMYGYTREEQLARSIPDFEVRATGDELRREIEARRRSGASRFETLHRRKDGKVLAVEVSTTYRPSTGTFLAFLRDVTERTASQAQLQESLAFNRTILASLVDGIVILDRAGTIISVNDAWERSTLTNGGPEAPAGTGVGVNYLEVCHRAGDMDTLNGVGSVLSGRSAEYFSEYPCHSPREFRWFSMEVMPLRRKEGGAVVIHRNITGRKKAEEELQRLRMESWHAHRVAQTGAIAASLAHELNQPLAAILSNAQAGARLMNAAEPDLAEIREILEDIARDDKRAAAVIAGLRSMLRRKETYRESLDLATTAREVLALAHSELLARDVDVELGAEPGIRVSADSAQIQQVVLNLVMNAVEAMENQPSERRRLVISLSATPEGDALLAVRDRGTGISEDQHTKLFEAFWTTKPHGMGIGLPICRSIIESHGGRMWFANNEDHGVTFFVSLPLSGERRPRGAPRATMLSPERSPSVPEPPRRP